MPDRDGRVGGVAGQATSTRWFIDASLISALTICIWLPVSQPASANASKDNPHQSAMINHHAQTIVIGRRWYAVEVEVTADRPFASLCNSVAKFAALTATMCA